MSKNQKFVLALIAMFMVFIALGSIFQAGCS
jgi:hypothetical protein